MDRMLYIGMNGAKQVMQAQAVNANNLANVSTTAFKQDLHQFRSMSVFGDGLPSRAYSMVESPGTDSSVGTIQATGRELDIAIDGEGWIAVLAADGSEAYTRAGSLRMDESGLVTTRDGMPVLGRNEAPIIIPQAEKVEILSDGTISIRAIGQAASSLADVERIKLVNPDNNSLTKGVDGLMRLKDGTSAAADASVSVVAGALEGSNVNAVSAMVNMIELSRQYEMQVKMMNIAKENDESDTQVMRLA